MQVYLVGTSGLARSSSRDAVSAIESVRPGVVVLQLDEARCHVHQLLKARSGCICEPKFDN